MIALIFEAALRSLALGVVVWLAMLILKPRNPHLQKTLWIAVLMASLAMPFMLNTRLAPSFDLPWSFFDMPSYVVTLTQSTGSSPHIARAAVWQWTLSATLVY